MPALRAFELSDLPAAIDQTVMARLLRELDYRSRRMLELRYGLGGDHPRALNEVGRTFNVTRERILQIEGEAITLLALARGRTYGVADADVAVRDHRPAVERYLAETGTSLHRPARSTQPPRVIARRNAAALARIPDLTLPRPGPSTVARMRATRERAQILQTRKAS